MRGRARFRIVRSRSVLLDCDTGGVSARKFRAPPFVVSHNSAIARPGRGSGSQPAPRNPGHFLELCPQVCAGMKGLSRGRQTAPATGGYLMKFKTLGVASSLAIVAGLAAPAHAQNQ